MLSEEEAKALERLSLNAYSGLKDSGKLTISYRKMEDLYLASRTLKRLYPPGWNDPVTPERLVELGGELDRFSEFPDSCYVFFGPIGSKWYVEFNGQAIVGWKPHSGDIPRMFFPRNMKEARELLVKCGAIKEEK